MKFKTQNEESTCTWIIICIILLRIFLYRQNINIKIIMGKNYLKTQFTIQDSESIFLAHYKK
jgi:hypothetical protein